jgi:hypothetical protein
MRDLGQRYVQYFNRRYSRSGTLWEGRFHSSVAPTPSLEAIHQAAMPLSKGLKSILAA